MLHEHKDFEHPSSLPSLQQLLCAREILQVVDDDGVLGRHDKPDLVIVGARGLWICQRAEEQDGFSLPHHMHYL